MTEQPPPEAPATEPAIPELLPLAEAITGPLPDSRARDLLLMMVFVLSQHGQVDKAGLLAEALHVLGDASPELLLARAVLRFQRQEWASALACLDALDRVAPVERFGAYTLTERERMRRFLRARCLHELQESSRARDALASYLRHGGVADQTTGEAGASRRNSGKNAR